MKPGSIQCFLLVPLGIEAVSLRRYSRDGQKCPGPFGYHNAHFHLGDSPELNVATHCDGIPDGSDERPAASDPRWPAKCEHCDYIFAPADNYQRFAENLFRRSDNGEVTTIRQAPPGAMWFADWYPASFGSPSFMAKPESERKRGHLILRCPGGDWDIDSKSRNGDGWTRTGEAPNVTANPSILIPDDVKGGELFHGWLREGILSPC